MDIQMFAELLSKRLDWNLEEIEITRANDSAEGYYNVQGIDNNTQEPVEGDLYIDDGISAGFDYDTYKKQCPEEKTFIAVFNDYTRERELYINAKYKKQNEKHFRAMWETKVSIYRESISSIKLTVDKEGINYLEFNNGDIEGFCFNAKMVELLELLRVTGNNLYRDNVRIGLSRGVLSRRLKDLFRDYIVTSILDDDKFCDKYGVRGKLENEQNSKRPASLFWYSHNGITIYSKKQDNQSRIKRYASVVELQPNEVSVINGAQTISDFQVASEEIKQILLEIDKRIDKQTAQDAVNQSLEKIMVKTTIIDGPSELVGQISLGLNTQIPVGDDEQVANSKDVTMINAILEAEKLRIIRAGEYIDDYCMLPKRFVKLFYAVQGKPGTARNLNAKNLVKDVSKAKKDITADKSIVHLLKEAIKAERWWYTNKQYRIDHSYDIESIMKNARYYYCSYWIKYRSMPNINEDNAYEKAFDSIVKKIKDKNDEEKNKNNRELSSNDFKKDDLFKDVVAMLEEEYSSMLA